jgi:medium-chain acyl-[acyl-carrier-protein] hydrolase
MPVKSVRFSNGPATEWFVYPKPNPAPVLRLYCFPYAGGSAGVFRSWPRGLPASVEVCAIQLPGHGNRVSEPPMTRIAAMVEAIYADLVPWVEQPFAFFGHSMGAIIAFELTRLLARRVGRSPRCLFVSGRPAPQLPRVEEPTYDRSNEEFVVELQRLNGTPPEILSSPETIKLFLPSLRADFEAVETYEYIPGPPLKTPIVAFAGLYDSEVGVEEMELWRLLTHSDFRLRLIEGDHFFVHAAESQLLGILSEELSQLPAKRL